MTQATTSPAERPKVQSSTAEVLAAENHRLRLVASAAEDRAETAEAQLLRVHRAVRAAQQGLRDAKQKRNEILDAAQNHASELVRQAQLEADRIRGFEIEEAQATKAFLSVDHIGSRAANWSDADPTLDDRLEEYLQTDLEPDASREWILGDRAN